MKVFKRCQLNMLSVSDVLGLCCGCVSTDVYCIAYLDVYMYTQRTQQAADGLWSSAAWLESAYHAQFWVVLGIVISELRQADPVFGVRSGFCACKITRLCVHQLRFVRHWLVIFWFYILTPATLKSNSNQRWVAHVRCTFDANLLTVVL